MRAYLFFRKDLPFLRTYIYIYIYIGTIIRSPQKKVGLSGYRWGLGKRGLEVWGFRLLGFSDRGRLDSRCAF